MKDVRLPSALNGRPLACWLIAVVAVAGLEFAMSLYSTGGRVFHRAPDQYYSLATQAMISGHLALPLPPRPELLALPNPYDAATNQPYRMQDLSLYRGRYYFYWGPAPIVLLFGPVHALTGAYPSQSLACAVFGTVAFGALSWLVLALRQAWFPSSSPSLAALLVACLAACTLLVPIGGADDVYAVPIACGAACWALAAAAVFRALANPGKRISWVAIAGIFLSLAVASRPLYIFWIGAWALAIPGLVHGKREALPRVIAAAALPTVIVIAGLMALNAARFGNPFEFGLHYQLMGSGQSPGRPVDLRNLPGTLKIYFWNLPSRTAYFPYVALQGEAAFGVFSCYPIVWLFPAVFLAALDGPRRWFLAAVGASAALAFLASSSVSAVVERYMIDFLPELVLAGCMGALVLSERLPRWRMGRAAALGIAAASALSGACLSFEFWLAHDWNRARVLAPLARIADTPRFFYEHLRKIQRGPVVIHLVLPGSRSGAFEPILQTERASGNGGDLVFVHYFDAGHIRLGFFQTDTTHWLSAPIAVDYAKEHVLRLDLGAFAPPLWDPVYANWTDEQIRKEQQRVAIAWDGDTIYETGLDFGFAAAELPEFGTNSVAPGASGPRFTGRIVAVDRLPFAAPPPRPPEDRREFGPWRVMLRLPAVPPPGRHDPVLTSGAAGRGDFVFVSYPRPGVVVFSHDYWGVGGETSRFVEVDPSRSHVVEVGYGGLYPPLGDPIWSDLPIEERRSLKNRIVIRVDGRAVMDEPDGSYDASPDSVTPGINRIGGSTTAPNFSGKIESAKRLPWPESPGPGQAR